MNRRLAGALLGLLCMVGCSAGPPQPAHSTLVLGVDAPQTGPEAADGMAVVDAVRQVLNDEYRGSIEGLPVAVRAFDDSADGRRDPAQGERNLRQMVADRSLVGIVGPLNSDVAGAEIPVASSAHLAMVSPSASNECLTKALPGCLVAPKDLRGGQPNDFFRVVPTADLEPPALVAYATGTLHVTHVAVASDGQAYGKSIRSAFETALKVAGFTPVTGDDLDPNNATALDAFLAEAKNGGADSVFFAGRGDGGACKVQPRVAAKLGATVPFFGGSGLQGAACLKDLGASAAPGFYTISAGSGTVGERAKVAARALLTAFRAAVKADGGNLPAREDVRLAVSQSVNPHFDPNGDTRERVFTILKASGQPPAWLPADEVHL
ncbi:MAG: branched-chain amino acid ABC transporter substrate-binding protein [Candidatus Dormibacteraeota bacterium]|nr:branched-chain amino acid ABC transporter substrate-binding protein [Candidatus Dormibacteraeota bacterium]